MRSKGMPAQSEMRAMSFRPQLASIWSSFSTPTLSGFALGDEVDSVQQLIITIFDRIAALLIVDGAVC
ncbi:hypothetical protein MRB53_005076 [Persea americana]|uniref:Uncharacterized protein n=1 Tax=Persea americana TaxID=3435 RepID=A0ACC2MCI9_PERAE|nr:hypothetical protein MRB53_005076 [Persea americana]